MGPIDKLELFLYLAAFALRALGKEALDLNHIKQVREVGESPVRGRLAS